MSFRDYIKLAFCDNGTPSSARLLTAGTVLTSMVGLLFFIIKTHSMPDGMTLTGLGAYATSPYAVHRASKMFGKDADGNNGNSSNSGGTTVVDQTKVVVNQ
jgi:hypothetical protein